MFEVPETLVKYYKNNNSNFENKPPIFLQNHLIGSSDLVKAQQADVIESFSCFTTKQSCTSQKCDW